MEKKNRIILFWTLTILGFLAHSLADALPAFWGQSIAAQPGPAPVGMMAFMVCLTYLVPVIGILLMVYGGKTARIINAVLIAVLVLTVPVAILAMRLAERALKKPAATLK